MKINGKKILAFLSSAVLSLNILCGSICYAEETDTVTDNSFQTGTDISVQGTDAFGNMLAAELQSAQDQQIENNGQNIFSVEMNGKTATVEYDVTEDCSVVVGIYDESGTTMLASGYADISADEKSNDVTIGIDTMPQYYYIKAFLVDKLTMRPLCSVYENPMYTKEMQEFLAKTTDDFDADKVYNLDNDKTNNFAVFNDEVIVLDAEPVSSENGKAVFNGITDELRTLTSGMTVAYFYNDQLYVYIITSVTTDSANNKAEITFSDTAPLELEEIFDYVKVDGEALTEDSTVTSTGDADESVIYLGMDVETSTSAYGGDEYSDEDINKDIDISGSGTVSHKFKIVDKEIAKKENEITPGGQTETGTVKVNGAVDFSVTASIKLYITLSEKYLEIKADYFIKLKIDVTAKVTGEIPLGKEIGFRIYPGVYFSITPTLVFEMSGSAAIEGGLSGTIGFRCDGKTITNLTTVPKLETKLSIEGKFFIGLSFSPKVSIISKKIVSAEMTAKVGFEITVKSDILQWDSTKLEKHDCTLCVKGELKGKFTLDLKLTLLNNKNLTYKITLPNVEKKLSDFYSSNISGFHFGSCPNKSYKTKIFIYDNNKKKVSNAVIYVDGKEVSRDSDEVTLYLKPGKYFVEVKSPDFMTSTMLILVEKILASEKENYKILYMYPKDYTGAGGIENSNQGGNGDSGVNNAIKKNRLSLGGVNSAYITENGDLYTWGYNHFGQLGDGTTTDKYTPTKIMSNVAQVNLEGNYSACITTNGDLYTWGYNERGQLGDGTTTDRYIPTKIISNVAQVSLGNGHSACITTNGDLYSWGYNKYGQLGNGTTTNSYLPIKIMSNVAQVNLENTHSACITTNGDLYTWGYNLFGNIGDGTGTDRNTPVKIMSNVAQVSLGGWHSACITKNGDLFTWGFNYLGELGDGTTTNRSTPKKIMSNVAQVSLGDSNSSCITTNGDLYTWGSGSGGTLGDGTTTSRNTPVKIMSNVSQVSIEGYSSACITANGDLFTWGGNNLGQLGDGTTADRYIPTKIMSNVAQFSHDIGRSACITTNGDLYIWGPNRYGELGDGTTTDRYTPTKITIPAETTIDYQAEYYSASTVQHFTGLLPNEVYNIYSMNSRTAEAPFSSDNLLYIDQKISDSSGNLSVEVSTNKNGIAPEIFVKAMNGGKINNAVISSLHQSGSSVSLSWEAVEGADRYTVYTIINGVFIKQAETNGLSCTVDGLAGGTEHGFIVQAWVNGEYSVLDKHEAIYIITGSPEDPVSAFVERLYTKVLNRDSEEAGKADWVSKLKAGVSATEVSGGFIFSEEFANRNLSNEEIITVMYRTFFDRDPDEGGFNDWVKKLNDGCSLELIFHGFTQSVEFNNLCTKYGLERGTYETTQPRDKSPNLTAFTSRMYTKALNRQYEVGGLNDWTGRYIKGEITLNDMAYGFIFSEEFTNKNMSDEHYVDTLYATFFDRAPDVAGKADWLGQLNSGSATREQVLNGFLGAEEFGKLVESFGL